jgi:hypothetical protein
MSVTADPATVPAFRPVGLVPGFRPIEERIAQDFERGYELAGVPLDTPLQPHHLAQ